MVILDTDAGLDDAAAILIGKHIGVHPNYYICTEGNTTANNVVRNVHILNKYLDLNASIIKGCEVDPSHVGDFYGEDGFANISSQMMEDYQIKQEDLKVSMSYDELKEELLHHEHITYIAIGPLITLADLIENEEIRNRIDHVYIMGGGIEVFNSPDDSEFNFHNNPSAVQKVFSTHLNITLFPLDLTIRQNLDNQQIEELANTGEYPEFITMFNFIKERTLEYDHLDAAILHDTMPILYAAYKDQFTIEDVKITCDKNGHLDIDDSGVDIHLVKDVNPSLLYDSLKKVFKLRS